MKRNLLALSLLAALALVGCGDELEKVGSGNEGVNPPPSSPYEALEQQVLVATNQLRQQPTSYSQVLTALVGQFQEDILTGKNGKRVRTQEGAPAVEEAIEYLKTAKVLGTLRRSAALDKAAQDHQKDQEKTGAVGHDGSDGSNPGSRTERYTQFQTLGENISYGSYSGDSGQDVVIALFVDDGVQDRGHRHNLFEPSFTDVGIACGPHPRYKVMCVMDYGSGLMPVKK